MSISFNELRERIFRNRVNEMTESLRSQGCPNDIIDRLNVAGFYDMDQVTQEEIDKAIKDLK